MFWYLDTLSDSQNVLQMTKKRQPMQYAVGKGSIHIPGGGIQVERDWIMLFSTQLKA